MTTPDHPTVPAGWQPDPATGRARWWDGHQWTDTFANTIPAIRTRPRNVFATISLIGGIIAMVVLIITPFLPVAFFAGLAGVAAGIDGILKARKGAAGKALAVWGLVLGAITMTIVSVLAVLYIRATL